MTAATPTCVDAPDLQRLSPEQRDAMRSAGRELRECQRVLEKAGLNVVGELLKGQGDFVELEHYPRDDVFDADTHGQYYYHAHRGGELSTVIFILSCGRTGCRKASRRSMIRKRPSLGRKAMRRSATWSPSRWTPGAIPSACSASIAG